jgi:hypothetical protein
VIVGRDHRLAAAATSWATFLASHVDVRWTWVWTLLLRPSVDLAGDAGRAGGDGSAG